jgi:hypothetical protein
MPLFTIHVEQVDRFSKAYVVDAASAGEAEQAFRDEYPDLDLAVESNALDDTEQTLRVDRTEPQ